MPDTVGLGPEVWRLPAGVLGVLGIVAAVALLRRLSWGPLGVLVVGGINLVAAVIALIVGAEGAIVGVVISLAIVGAALPTFVGRDATVRSGLSAS